MFLAMAVPEWLDDFWVACGRHSAASVHGGVFQKGSRCDARAQAPPLRLMVVGWRAMAGTGVAASLMTYGWVIRVHRR